MSTSNNNTTKLKVIDGDISDIESDDDNERKILNSAVNDNDNDNDNDDNDNDNDDNDNDNDNDDDGYSDIDEDVEVYIETTETQLFRVIFECVKDKIHFGVLIVSKEGISLGQMDMSNTLTIDLYLKSTKFNRFLCSSDTHVLIPLDFRNFHKLIKSTNNMDTLTIIKYKDDYKLTIEIKNTTNKMRSFKLRLRDENAVQIKKVDNQNIVFLMDTAHFQEMCKDMVNIRDSNNDKMKVVFICSNKNVTFKGVSTFAEARIDYIYSGDDVKKDNILFTRYETEDLVQSEFNLHHVTPFMKCCSLCKNVEIHIDNDKPIIIVFKFALGTLSLHLMQRRKDITIRD